MIVSFQHKGLELFFTKGDPSKLPAEQISKIRTILALLHAANKVNDMNLPSLKLHPLKGKQKGVWAVKVTGNYRITFRFIESKVEAIDVDYTDYH
jgi:proteic killer suppression protein